MFAIESELFTLYERAKEQCPLPSGMQMEQSPLLDGFITLVQILAREALPSHSQTAVQKVTAIFSHLSNESLRNGYIEAMSNNDIHSAKACLNALMSKNSVSINNHEVSQSSFSNRPGSRNISITNSTRHPNSVPNLKPVEEEKDSGNRILNSESVTSTSNFPKPLQGKRPNTVSLKDKTETNSSGSESEVENSTNLKNLSSRHNEANRCEKKSNKESKYPKKSHVTDSSDELFQPSTSKISPLGRKKASHGSKPKSQRIQDSDTRSDSESESSPERDCYYRSEKVVKKSSHACSEKRHGESSFSESDRETQLSEKVKSKKKLPEKPERRYREKVIGKKNSLTPKDKIRKKDVQKPESRRSRSLQQRSPSVSSFSSDVSSPVKPIPPAQKKRLERISLSDSEAEVCKTKSRKVNVKSSKPGLGRSQTREKQITKNTKSQKPSSSKSSKSKQNTKSDDKENQKSKLKLVSEPSQDKPAKQMMHQSQFMDRLKVLESSLIEEKPSPLNDKPTKSKEKGKTAPVSKTTAVAKTKSTSAGKSSNKSNTNKTEKTAASKPKTKTDKKPKPASKQRTKPQTKKTGAIKTTKKTLPKTKASVKKNSKTDSNSEDKEKLNQERNENKVDSTQDVTKEEPSHKDSSFSSDESAFSDLDMQIQAGSLSTCLNSIKKKVSKPVGSATPPLNVFLSTMNRTLSDISETSSFDQVPCKQDFKSVVNRMAKANKPKPSSQPSIPSQLTPHTLKQIEKIGEKLKCNDSDSDSCSSDE